MKILESGEDYLENILILSRKLTKVRAIDIANETGYSKPSISLAMKKLKEKGYINIEKSAISLTEEGLVIANKIYERHQVLSEYLMSLGVSEANARKDACKIEHDISDETFAKIKQLIKK